MWGQVGNPEYRFSHIEAHLISGTMSTETTIVEDVRASTIWDPLVITLPIVIIVSSIFSALACLALLRYLFKHKLKMPQPNVPGSIALTSDSITLLETTEPKMINNNLSVNSISGVEVNEETIQMDDLRDNNVNETETNMEPTITEIPVVDATHVFEITTSL